MSSLTILSASPPDDGRLSRFLDSQAEYTVCSARSGTEALERLEDGGIDLLLFGPELPDATADELLERVRRHSPLLPAIYATDGSELSADAPPRDATATVALHRDGAIGRLRETIREIGASLRGETGPSHERYDRDVLNRTTDSFYALDEEWRFSYLNESAAELLQRPASELLGRPLWDAFPDATETVLYEEFTRAKETGEKTEFEFYYEPLEAWFRVTAYPSPDGMSVYFRDVTDRMLRARAMDAAELGVTIIDPHRPDCPIVYANEGFETLTGYAESEIRGRSCSVLRGPRTRSETVEEVLAAIDAREPIATEIINYRKDGTPFWNQVQITPVFDPNGELTHFIAFHLDVTARIEEEHRAELFNRVLRHNLRNSMNVVLGHASALEETAVAEDRIAPIVEHGEELLGIAERARDIDAVLERERFEPTAARLEPIVDAAANAVSRDHPDAEIATHVGDDVRVIASDALGVAFEELLDNAIVHADRSVPTVTVTTTADTRRLRPEADERPVVRVSVLDSAPPLTDQERTVLVGEEETPLRHGSGLGLWLVQWVVTMVGGSITVAERPSGGNEITVTLLAAETENSSG